MAGDRSVTFRVTEDHIQLLKGLYVETRVFVGDEGEWSPGDPYEICPDTNKKRLFGNSGPYDQCALETLGERPDESTGEYPKESLRRARLLLAQLPLAWQAVMRHGAVEPCTEELDRHGPWFQYRSRRALEFWRPAIAASGLGHGEGSRFVEFLMNARNGTPMDVLRDAMSYRSVPWMGAAVKAMEAHAVAAFREQEPGHGAEPDGDVLEMLLRGRYALPWKDGLEP